MEPSSNCTNECTIDWGCTTTSISEGFTSNNQAASITSKPLFIKLAESIVIFAPIDQFGCFNAWALVTWANCSRLKPRKGPPEAVNITFSIGLWDSPTKHWKMAECSESTGKIGTPISRAKGIIRAPATTKVSLFAKAIGLPALIAFTVGNKPA